MRCGKNPHVVDGCSSNCTIWKWLIWWNNNRRLSRQRSGLRFTGSNHLWWLSASSFVRFVDPMVTSDRRAKALAVPS